MFVFPTLQSMNTLSLPAATHLTVKNIQSSSYCPELMPRKDGSKVTTTDLTAEKVEVMTDEELRAALITQGDTVGPIVDSTRSLYKKKLKSLLLKNATNQKLCTMPFRPQPKSPKIAAISVNPVCSPRKGDPAVVAAVTAMSQDQLRSAFQAYGKDPGPIVGSTRHTYEKRLIKLRTREIRDAEGVPCDDFSSDDEDMEWLPA